MWGDAAQMLVKSPCRLLSLGWVITPHILRRIHRCHVYHVYPSQSLPTTIPSELSFQGSKTFAPFMPQSVTLYRTCPFLVEELPLFILPFNTCLSAIYPLHTPIKSRQFSTIHRPYSTALSFQMAMLSLCLSVLPTGKGNPWNPQWILECAGLCRTETQLASLYSLSLIGIHPV